VGDIGTLRDSDILGLITLSPNTDRKFQLDHVDAINRRRPFIDEDGDWLQQQTERNRRSLD